ncbi:ArsA family ATPase [Nitrososphaera viennensis]|uniref:ArsA family ATPase n=2 Tax=Nitrososphaera viennensis TaxID=1034015 RepID=A0A977NLB9_9ARCH|nr:ArsA family ATPase [Nitrososphaera viennensis]AIC16644.1 putative arsenical pump-driving ATPase ArsA [Nitrososphaera viennensis EN76]UVS68568.1 ArsA family ATPase [Nitrososphaera viennensis]
MRLIIYTGKGGTGKTVTSCATGLKLARRGHRTLVLSADPAHTLADAFMMPEVGHEPGQVAENLVAQQIDPVTEMSKQYSTILSYMASVFSAKGIDETLAYEIAMLPGMTQLFSLLKIEEVSHTGEFDAVVLDMPASGEALRYLYFPKLVGSIGRKLTGLAGLFSGFAKVFQPLAKIPAPSRSVIQSEVDLMDRLDSLAEIIKDSNVTSLRLVANPDTFSIENAKRAMMSASLYGINVDMAVVNKIMAGSSDAYYDRWASFQHGKVEEAKANFYPLPVKEVQLYATELRGMEMLAKHGDQLFGDEDPAKVFYRGQPYAFEKDGAAAIRMTVQVPFSGKDDFAIERYGDSLTLSVKTAAGKIVNIVPLPVATSGMKLARARLEDRRLLVLFEK